MSDADTTSPLQIGRYLLFEAIASGGQASVHFGRLSGAEGFGRTVAIKRVMPAMRGDRSTLNMLIDEARLASRVVHPNVVQTVDLVAHGDELLVVMEYVQGETVGKLLTAATKRGVYMPCDVAAAIVHGALKGLAAAHGAVDEVGAHLEIVHRDVSPQNIIVDVHGVPRLLDFGIAKARVRSQTSTEVGTVKGKLAYMAPEQLRGTISPAIDLWAVGAVMWELLTGRRLFTGANDEELITAILTVPPVSPSGLRADVPAELDAVVLKALSANPNDRYASAAEMIAELEKTPLAPAHKVAEWMKALVQDRLDASAKRLAELQSVSALPTYVPTASRKSRPWGWIAAAAAATVLLVGGVVAVVRTPSQVEQSPVAPAPPPVPAPAPVPEPPPAPLPPPPLPPPAPDPKPVPPRKKVCGYEQYVKPDGHTGYKKVCR